MHYASCWVCCIRTNLQQGNQPHRYKSAEPVGLHKLVKATGLKAIMNQQTRWMQEKSVKNLTDWVAQRKCAKLYSTHYRAQTSAEDCHVMLMDVIGIAVVNKNPFLNSESRSWPGQWNHGCGWAPEKKSNQKLQLVEIFEKKILDLDRDPRILTKIIYWSLGHD